MTDFSMADNSKNVNISLIDCLLNLWVHIDPYRRYQFCALLILMILTSLVEVLSIGAVLPFLGVLTAPERIFNAPMMAPVNHFFGFSTSRELLFPLTVIFGLTMLLAGIMRLLMLWASTRLSFSAGSDLGMSIYRRTLYQPYAVHCARNSSEVISGISGKANQIIYSTILPVLTLVSSGVMLIFILIPLLLIQPIICLLVFSGFGLIYLVIARLVRKQLLADSKCVAHESTEVIKSLQEGLGGIRDVLVDGSQEFYCQLYCLADFRLRRAQANSFFIGSSPRYILEAFGAIFIALLAYSLAQQDGIEAAIPVLGVLALGAQRLLPVLQQAYSAWALINGGQASLQDSLELLGQPTPDNAGLPVEKMQFKHSIVFKDVSFRYESQTPYVLRQVSLRIPKGGRIGFIGSSGSGKSTLLDILMGLLTPTGGVIEVDGTIIKGVNARAWQMHIAHVPQFIFLADSSVEENIAFGVPKNQIDLARVRIVAQQAQLADFIESLPNQYKTFVGEHGVRLSGGQRQRIGIARALYKRADVLIFDEATSALDNETEQAVMQSITALSKDLTIFLIAHRLTTLKDCTQIVELGNGMIKRVGSYADIVNIK